MYDAPLEVYSFPPRSFCPPRSVFAHQGPFLPTKVLSVFAVLLSCYIVLYCRFAVFAVFAVFALLFAVFFFLLRSLSSAFPDKEFRHIV